VAVGGGSQPTTDASDSLKSALIILAEVGFRLLL
jgi:hypothetical protein